MTSRIVVSLALALLACAPAPAPAPAPTRFRLVPKRTCSGAVSTATFPVFVESEKDDSCPGFDAVEANTYDEAKDCLRRQGVNVKDAAPKDYWFHSTADGRCLEQIVSAHSPQASVTCAEKEIGAASPGPCPR